MQEKEEGLPSNSVKKFLGPSPLEKLWNPNLGLISCQNDLTENRIPQTEKRVWMESEILSFSKPVEKS